MGRIALTCVAALAASQCSAPTSELPTPEPVSPYAAPAELPVRSARLIVDTSALWAGHRASGTITSLALPSGARRWQTSLGCVPATLARSGGNVYAACEDSGDLVVLDEDTGKVVQRRRVGHGAFGVIAVPGRVFVTLHNDDAVVALAPSSLREIARAAAGRQPRGLALGRDALYVVDLFDVGVRAFEPATLAPKGQGAIGLGAALAESLTLRPDGSRAYIPHQRMNVTNLARTFDGTVFPVVSVVDLRDLTPIRREALGLDGVDRPVSQPAAVVIGPRGDRLYVANAASDDLSVIDLSVGSGIGHVVLGQDPRDVALSSDGARLYALNEMSGDVSVVDTTTLAVTATLHLAEDPRPAQIHLGERIFRTSRPETIARDHWIACASCHWDAGIDGVTWLGADGGPRNTTTLRGLNRTAPFHWSGDRPDIQSFQKTFKGLMAGQGLSPAELDALSAFLLSLSPVASPRRSASGALSSDATRGAEVFKAAGCPACHEPKGGLFTDRQLHDVGTGTAALKDVSGKAVPETIGSAFKTPSLRELWLTAPYLHDGRAATLRDVLVAFNARDAHGRTSDLSEPDLRALETFLLSLPLTGSEERDLFGR